MHWSCSNIVDPVTMQGPDGPRKPVGTGPFTFVEWAQGDHTRVVKNKSYWQSGRPYLDEIVTTVLRDPQAMVVSLESGALDLALNPPLNDFVRLQKAGKYQTLPNPLSGSYYALVPNVTVAPLENKQVRQALNFAIDRQRILDQVLQGIGRTEDLPWAPSSPAYEPDKNTRYAFDLDKAKSLLGSAGVSGLKLDVMYSTAVSALGTIAQIMQSDLAKIGVSINLAPTEPADGLRGAAGTPLPVNSGWWPERRSSIRARSWRGRSGIQPSTSWASRTTITRSLSQRCRAKSIPSSASRYIPASTTTCWSSPTTCRLRHWSSSRR